MALDNTAASLEKTSAANKSNVRCLTYTAIFTALTCVLSQLSIPMPAGVPMTLQTLIIPIAGIILGAKWGTVSTLIYLLLGAVGIPVFAGGTAGVGVLFGMTGGFLVSFPLLSLFAGLGSRKNNKAAAAIGLILGAVLNYLVGTIWFVVAAPSTFSAAFTACVLPFIPTAIIKIIAAEILGLYLKKVLTKAGLAL
ncbi:MAG: biotin transporter BioY [Eubacterium sp.]|nr:biotin transporter BioY [Eubacterium sp.]